MSPAVPRAARLAAAVITLALGACPADEHGHPSGSTCPPDNTLTYDSFARGFMETYCTRCHASTLSGPERHGAPLFHDFDTEVGILNVGNHVDQYAAAGPFAINTLMPPDAPAPTEAERRLLGQWLACEGVDTMTGGGDHH